MELIIKLIKKSPSLFKTTKYIVQSKIIQIPFCTIKIVFGYFLFLLSKDKNTPEFSYHSLVRLFCLTQGYALNPISSVISILNPPLIKENLSIKSKLILPEEVEKIAKNLNEKGYYVLKSKLSDEYLDALLKIAMNKRCCPRQTDYEASIGKKTHYIDFYPRDNPLHIAYDFNPNDLINEKVVQELFSDLGLLYVIQNYLNATPILDFVALWWHNAISNIPDKYAAQFFHFDLDRVKWLKVFFYLTDVGPNNGPHTFISATNKSGEIPKKILQKGYTRLTDEEVSSCYSQERFVEFIGTKGTIIIEDTRGLHKGKNLKEGDRSILQLQFSNSLFGSTHPKYRFNQSFFNQNDPLKRVYNKVFSNFL